MNERLEGGRGACLHAGFCMQISLSDFSPALTRHFVSRASRYKANAQGGGGGRGRGSEGGGRRSWLRMMEGFGFRGVRGEGDGQSRGIWSCRVERSCCLSLSYTVS